MSYLGLQKPTNKIVAAGTPLVTYKKVETATTMYPGRLVIKGTNADDVVVGTAAGAVYGWLGYEQTDPNYQPADVDTIYTAGDQAAVLFGGHFVVVACLATSQTIVAGDRLVATASGTVSKATAAIVTTGAATASAVDATTPHVSGSVGAEGMIVGIAQESVTTTSAVADIMVLSLI
jgi:hypothetical protein